MKLKKKPLQQSDRQNYYQQQQQQHSLTVTKRESKNIKHHLNKNNQNNIHTTAKMMLTSHTNHFPLSSSASSSLSTSTQKQQKQKQSLLNLTTKNKNDQFSMMRSSPYRQLPTLESERKEQLFFECEQGYGQQGNWFNNNSDVSDGNKNYSKNFHKEKSVYEQMTQSSRVFDTQRDGDYNNSNSIYETNNYRRGLNENDSYSFAPMSQPPAKFAKRLSQQSQNQQQPYMYTPQHNFSNNKNPTTKSTQLLMREQINNKLQRVCSKVGNLSKSRQKNNNNNNINMNQNRDFYNNNHGNFLFKKENLCKSASEMTKGKNINNVNRSNNFVDNSNNNNNNKLCYSSIIYQPSTQASINMPDSIISYNLSTNSSGNTKYTNTNNNINLSYQKITTLQQQHQKLSQNDNKIHQHILPSQPSIIQTYELKIIQLQKRVSLQGSKIVKLQEDLLKQRQLLIKKQKQWLLRENQLLSWIEESEKEMDEMRERLLDSGEGLLQVEQCQSFRCPQPQSERFEISMTTTTKRNESNYNNNNHNNKHHYRHQNNKSLLSKHQQQHNNPLSLSLSGQKSTTNTTNRKHKNNNNLISTHKKNHPLNTMMIARSQQQILPKQQQSNLKSNNNKKSIQIDQKNKYNDKLSKQNKNYYKQQDYYCDQVFYDISTEGLLNSVDARNDLNSIKSQYKNNYINNKNLSIIQQQQLQQKQKKQSNYQRDYQLYQLISLQAMAIEKFVNNQSKYDSPQQQQQKQFLQYQDQQQQEEENQQENLLLSSNHQFQIIK